MNRIVELSDTVYPALEQAARANGMTAADWIAAGKGEADGRGYHNLGTKGGSSL